MSDESRRIDALEADLRRERHAHQELRRQHQELLMDKQHSATSTAKTRSQHPEPSGKADHVRSRKGSVSPGHSATSTHISSLGWPIPPFKLSCAICGRIATPAEGNLCSHMLRAVEDWKTNR